MALKPNESRDLKKTYKRIGWFLLGILLIDGFFGFLLYYYFPNINDVLCGFIIIVITAALYLLYSWLCARFDKRKKERLERSGKKDPFSRN